MRGRPPRSTLGVVVARDSRTSARRRDGVPGLHAGPLAALRRGSESQKSSCAIVMSSAAATFLRIDLRSFPRFSCLA